MGDSMDLDDFKRLKSHGPAFATSVHGGSKVEFGKPAKSKRMETFFRYFGAHLHNPTVGVYHVYHEHKHTHTHTHTQTHTHTHTHTHTAPYD
jgi:hypothetical protein